MGRSDSTQSQNDEDYLDSFDPELRRAFDLAENKVDPKIIGDRSQVKIRKDSILLSGDSTFYTLQGEGPTIGEPCVFIRLHVCNLRCVWCDAYYTWSPESEEFWTEGHRVSFEECAELIRRTWTGSDVYPKKVVWTGGEPLIQRKQIDEVMKVLNKGTSVDWSRPGDLNNKDFWTLEIETNGTLMPTNNQLWYAQFNCSPKLGNSENKHYSMVKPKVLEKLNKAKTTFKFVCRNEQDLEEIEEKYVSHIDESKIIIMPEGIVEKEITKHARVLYESVLRRGWRMTPRFQAIFAEGARRGV